MAKKTKITSPVKSLKGLEMRYQKELMKFGRAMVKSVRADVLSILKSDEKEYALDGISTSLQIAFSNLSRKYTGLETATFAMQTSEKVIGKTEASNKSRFYRSLQAVTGVNVENIVAEEGLEDLLALSRNKNEILIKSLSEEYLKSVETIVNNGVVNGSTYKEIEKQITARVGSAASKLSGRIKTIARNEVSTVNAQLTLRRSKNLGIKKGIYRTAEDERVRKCHKELDGKEFEISKGAWSPTCGKFIQPGITDINCRCFYTPIIEVENVTA